MLETPLHSALVHVPLGLTVLAPIILTGLFLYRKAEMAKKTWIFIILTQFIGAESAILAKEYAEQDEHIVESAISEQIIEEDEERAETFTSALIATLAISILAFFIKKENYSFYFFSLTLFFQILVVGLGHQVGSSGGELVYKYGATKTFIEKSTIKK